MTDTALPPGAPGAPGPPPPRPAAQQFNLRELLIAASLFVLALIALTPGFQARRMRAQISRARADLRSLATAIEAYFVDMMSFPASGSAEGPSHTWGGHVRHRGSWSGVLPSGVPTFHSGLPRGTGARRMLTFRTPQTPGGFSTSWTPHTLTTPVAYIWAYPMDPFADTVGATYGYAAPHSSWILWSPGPDRDENAPDGPGDVGGCVEIVFDPEGRTPSEGLTNRTYDPTNGVRSNGDIVRTR